MRVSSEAEEQVFAPALDAIDSPPDQALLEIARNRPAQTPVIEPHGRHFVTFYVRGEAAAGRFDLGELGHGKCTAGFVAAPTIP